MKKLLMLTGAIIALCGVTSCSDDNVSSLDSVSTQSEERTPISFGTYVGNNKSTRAGSTGAIYKDNLPDKGFGVFAYNTGTQTFKEAYTASENNSGQYQVNYMFNSKVTGSGNPTSWTTTDLTYWPNPTTDPTTLKPLPQYVTFLAYGPYADDIKNLSGESSGILGFGYCGKDFTIYSTTAATNRSDPYIHFSTKPAPKQVTENGETTTVYEGVDLLWGTAGKNGAAAKIDDYTGTLPNQKGTNYSPGVFSVNSDLTKMKTDGKVQFVFKHALGGFGGSPGTTENNSGQGILIDYYADQASASGNQTVGPVTENNGKTKVFVNWLAVEFMSNMESGDDSKPYKELQTEGKFDLLTGQWVFDKEDDDPSLVNYTKNTRPRIIYYFSPDGSDYHQSGYYKYPQLYEANGTNYNNITVYPEKLNRRLFTQFTAGNYNTYNECVANDGTWKQGVNTGVMNTAHTVYQNSAAPLYFIPGSKVSVKVVVNYDIVTPDANIANTHYTVTHQEMAKEVAFTNPIIMNRLYALYIHLGLTSIKVDAIVDAFTTNTDDTTEGITPTVAESEEVTISPNEVP